jgi:hypothetical protein
MEEKRLSKGEWKKELALEKLEEIEEAYFDLMKAYSSCLTTLNLKAQDCYFNRFWLTPKIVRHRIGQHVNFLREVFLSLIAQNRDKIDSKVIKKIELYCDDMNKLSVQVTESGFATRFYGIPGAIAALIPGIIIILTAIEVSDIRDPVVLFLVFISFVSFYIAVSIFYSVQKSTRVLTVTGVQEKQKTIFNLLQEYLECV